MSNKSDTVFENQKDIIFHSPEEIFKSPELDDTKNISIDSNCYNAISNGKDNVSIEVNIEIERNKQINKKLNE